MNDQNGVMVTFSSHVPFLLGLMGMHFLNVLSRIVFAPFMPTIEGNLRIGILGKMGSCSLGIVVVGLLPMGSSLLLRYLELQEDGAERTP